MYMYTYIIVTSNKQSSGHLIQNVGCTRRGCGSAGRGYGSAALEDGAGAGTRLVLYLFLSSELHQRVCEGVRV